MKTNEYSKIIKSLCAVFLACGVISSFLTKTVLASETTAEDITTESVATESIIVETSVETTLEIPVETTTAETTTTEITTEESTTVEILVETPVETTTEETIEEETPTEQYKYNITIEFGALQFYYDWGEWSPSAHQYRADISSSDPAAGITDGLPGWYGFDGTNNRIKVINNSEGYVFVTLSFDMNKDDTYNKDNVGMYVELKKENITMSVYTDSAFLDEVSTDTSNHYEFKIANTDAEIWYLSFSGEPLNQDGTKFKSPTPRAIGFLTISVSLDEPSSEEPPSEEPPSEEPIASEASNETSASEETTAEEPLVLDGGLDS